MNAYDMEADDRLIHKKTAAIYEDPKRHKFYSQYQRTVGEDWRGPRRGKTRGKKRLCAHCGKEQKGHALEDERVYIM